MRPSRLLSVYLPVFATGSAGLIYEVAWQRYLSRLLGSDTAATAVILAVFLGGLSIGYLLCGLLTVRVRRHFRAYGWLEAGIGLWGLAFPQLFALVDGLTANWSFAPPYASILQGTLCSALLMGPPTAAMGGTVPFLTRGLSRDLGEATQVHARVYAVNTAGAFLGALLAGFLLVPELGLPSTVRIAALLNLAAAACFLPRTEASQASPIPPSPATGQSPGRAPAVLLGVACLSGFYVMTLENVLIRVVNLSLGSSSYAFTMIVSAFILAIAAGGWAVGRARRIPDHALFANQVLIVLALVALYLSLDTWPYWAHRLRISFGHGPAEFSAFHASAEAILALALLPAAGLMGATAPLVFHELKRSLADVGRHSGTVFAWNTLGNLAGSLLGGIGLYVLLADRGGHGSVFLAATGLAALSAALAGSLLSRRAAMAGLAMGLALLAAAPFAPAWDSSRFAIGTFRLSLPEPYSWDGPAGFYARYLSMAGIRFYTDGPDATVAVVETRDPDHPDPAPLAIMVNGKSDSSTEADERTIKLAAHLPALLAPARGHVLVVGLGTGVTSGELALYPDTASLDTAEISPSVVRALPLFAPFTGRIEAEPRHRIVLGDAFRILRREGQPKAWDIIVSEPSNPWVMGVDLLFTTEFYRLVSDRLSPGGLFVQWIHIFDASQDMVAMVAATLGDVFPHCRAFMTQANDVLFLASKAPLGPEAATRARATLAGNDKVRRSLGSIGLDSVEALLLREIWSPSHFATFREGQQQLPRQTLDQPRLHYLAGRSYFAGRRVPASFLLPPATAPHAGEYLLPQLVENWDAYPPDRKTLDRLLSSAEDPYLDAAPLPAAEALRLRAYLRRPELLTPEEREEMERKRSAGARHWLAP